jgi:hypothetical protein
MPEDRRETDKIILDRLDKISDKVGNIEVNLALNTRDTGRIAELQKTANGKVAAHEASIQALQAQQVLTTTYIKKEDEAKEKQNDRKYETRNRWVWVLIGLGISIGGQILLYLIQGDVLKRIFIN